MPTVPIWLKSPNPQRTVDIDFSTAQVYRDLRQRVWPANAAAVKNSITCVDYNSVDNTWTEKPIDSVPWVGDLGAYFPSSSMHNFGSTIVLGPNANSSGNAANGAVTKADGAAGAATFTVSNVAAHNFTDCIKSVLTSTIPAGTVTDATINAFSFLLKPLAIVGQALVRISTTNTGGTPDSEIMIIDLSHPSLTINEYSLIHNDHPAVTQKARFLVAGTKIVLAGGTWASVWFSASHTTTGVSYAIDPNTVTALCHAFPSVITTDWLASEAASESASWPVVFPAQAACNNPTPSNLYTNYPLSLNTTLTSFPTNDVCSYFEGYLPRGQIDTVTRMSSVRYNDGGVINTKSLGLGFHPTAGTSNANISLTHNTGTVLTENHKSIESMGLHTAGTGFTQPAQQDRSDWVYFRCFWRKSIVDGLRIFVNGQETLPANEIAGMTGPWVSSTNINEFIVGVSRNGLPASTPFIISRDALWYSIPFTPEEMITMSSLSYGAGGGSQSGIFGPVIR